MSNDRWMDKEDVVHLLCAVLSYVQLFVTPWTVAHQAPLSMAFSRQEYGNGLPFPPSGDLPNPGIKYISPVSPVLAGRLFTIEPPGKLFLLWINCLFIVFAPQPQCACVRVCVCVCVCVVFFHGVLCFLPKFFWISWIRTWTFGKAFPVSILSIYERSEYGRTFGRSKHEPLSTSTRVWVEVGFLFCYSLVSSPDCLGGVWRQRQLNINAVQLAQCKNRFRGSGFCYCIIEASTFNLHLWYHYSFTFW